MIRRSAGSVGLVLLAMLAMPAPPLAGQASVPSPQDVLGYGIGQRFTDASEVVSYFQALAQASDRVVVEEYGRSLEGRHLIQAIIALPEYHQRLPEILALNRELTDPETTPVRAAEIAATNPTVVYFSYGIHGNESSSSEAALWTAWDLAREAPEVAGVLEQVVVVLDPVVNPDGRDRYVHFFRQAMGRDPNPNIASREHREPWPGGRFNHYLFDLNRDWAWMSQHETQARLATWDRWNPQVHVDFHEMSYASSYFFFPAARPINPAYPSHTLEWGQRFGEGNAQAFDEKGWLYYTGEDFDLFYPGYGDSWPSLLGAIGMTYEQAGGGVAGLAVERPDGSILTLADRASRHRTTGQATLRTAAQGREAFLTSFAEFHRTVDEEMPDILLVPGESTERVEALVSLLLDQGIEVEKAEGPFGSQVEAHQGWEGRQEFPTGTYRVRARQPRGRLAITLLRPEVFLDATFSYDITGWSLPYAYGVEAHWGDGAGGEGSWSAVEEVAPPVAGGSGEGAFGYLLLPGFGPSVQLVNFLQDDGRVYALPDSFTIQDRHFPRGTLLLPRERNPELEEKVSEAGLRPFLHPVSTGLSDGGPDLGTGGSSVVELPSVGVLTGEGISPTAYGTHWFFLEERMGLPFDAVQVGEVRSTRLGDYDVLVVPSTSGGFMRELGDDGLESLEAWVRGGGTLVAVSNAAFLLGEHLAEVEEREAVEEDGDDRDARLAKALRSREERELERWADRIPGTILRLALDPGHPLAAGAGADGLPETYFGLSTGRGFEPEDRFESVAWFPDTLERVSGVISEANLERMAQSSWMVRVPVGSGRAILFADDPLFRMLWYSGFSLYANAILRGPGT